VLNPRIAKICADLLGVQSVRLYHDNALAKKPGCGRTPWHCDDDHFPLATHDVVTAWIPAQPIPVEMAPLAFAKPLGVYELVKNIVFNKFDTSYDKQVTEAFQSNHVSIEDGPFGMGEVSFHHNLSFHTAASNKTKQTRVVLANTFFADGARIVENPTMVSGDWQKFIPGVGPGEIAASELNPVCWPSSALEKV
jgi:ectoine hydroxylase-related dioxygenase (phytanoyl-CoA dioxygenase family)